MFSRKQINNFKILKMENNIIRKILKKNKKLQRKQRSNQLEVHFILSQEYIKILSCPLSDIDPAYNIEQRKKEIERLLPIISKRLESDDYDFFHND